MCDRGVWNVRHAERTLSMRGEGGHSTALHDQIPMASRHGKAKIDKDRYSICIGKANSRKGRTSSHAQARTLTLGKSARDVTLCSQPSGRRFILGGAPYQQLTGFQERYERRPHTSAEEYSRTHDRAGPLHSVWPLTSQSKLSNNDRLGRCICAPETVFPGWNTDQQISAYCITTATSDEMRPAYHEA